MDVYNRKHTFYIQTRLNAHNLTMDLNQERDFVYIPFACINYINTLSYSNVIITCTLLTCTRNI